MPGALHVHQEGLRGIGFADVQVRDGRGMNYNVGPELSERRPNFIGFRDVSVSARERENGVP
jgi:hypothetical protein